MAWNARDWEKLRSLKDKFPQQEFLLVCAFADTLPILLAKEHPGENVSGINITKDRMSQLMLDTSNSSTVRTLGREYRVDNPVDVLTKALDMIGIHVSTSSMSYSDSLATNLGKPAMKISESLIRESVHVRLFSEEGEYVPQDGVTKVTGMALFTVKVQYATPESDMARTERVSVRASSPEEAKSIVARIQAEKGHTNVSVLGVDWIKYTGPGAPGLVPETQPLNVNPNAMNGLVPPSSNPGSQLKEPGVVPRTTSINPQPGAISGMVPHQAVSRLLP